MNAHALPVDIREPHAQVGNHLRVNTHPLLGLPVAPFVVQRAVIDNRKLLNTRETASYFDVRGNAVTLPYTVTPEKPLRIEIDLGAPAGMCIWAEVQGISAEDLDRPSPSDADPPSNPTVFNPDRLFTGRFNDGLIGRVTGDLRRDLLGDLRNTDLFRDRFGSIIDRPPVDVPPVRPTPVLARRLSVEGFVNAAQGEATIGRRTGVPLALSAPGLVTLKVTGSGVVGGLRWIEANDPQRVQYETIAIMNLPHKGGARYLPINDAEAIARARAADQAPKRQPLQETVNTPAPDAAPLANAAFERDRIASLTPTLAGDLEVLINDLGADQFDHLVTERVLDENGVDRGSAEMRRIDRLFQAQADPGTASLIGYKMRDGDFPESENKIVFYRVAGFFHDFPRSLLQELLDISEDELFDAAVGRVPLAERTMPRDKLATMVQTLAGQRLKLPPGAVAQLEAHDRYMVLGTVAVADRMAVQDPVDPLVIVPPTSEEAAARTNWLPVTRGAARREVQVKLAGGRIGGLIAAGKREPATGTPSGYFPLNRKNGPGFHLPLMLGLRFDDETGLPVTGPGEGFVGDRNAGPTAIRYHVAQTDRFGRWSAWNGAVTPPGVRPRPPMPHIQGYYKQPTPAQAVSHGGIITAHVPLPGPEALAPGSNPIVTVRIIADMVDEQSDVVIEHIGVFDRPVSSRVPVANPPGTFRIAHEFPGPILPPMARRRARLTAVFIDDAGQLSVPSEPHRIRMNDPRAPAQPPIIDTLLYSARPDVTGLAWVEHRWTPPAEPPLYAVYYTDENRIRSHLETETETAVLEAIDAAPDAAARAGVLRANQGLLPDHLFERIDDAVRPFNSGQMGFRHGLSGSLRVLSGYKIAAESPNGGKPDLRALDILFFGVPNSDPPPRPTLRLRPGTPSTGEPEHVVDIDINLVAGVTEGQTWRLRRTRGAASPVTALPIVALGAMGPKDAATGIQTAQFRDTGPVEIAPAAQLQPWVRYAWVAEVQGAPESGSVATGRAVPGRWSQPSDPVSLILVPSAPPVAPGFERFNGAAAPGGLRDVLLRMTHPGPLDGASMGRFRLRVSRRLPGEGMTILSEEDLDPRPPLTALGSGSGEVVPFGAEYHVVLIDPVGRASAALVVTLSP
jgi:hypothetical protein